MAAEEFLAEDGAGLAPRAASLASAKPPAEPYEIHTFLARLQPCCMALNW